MMKETADIVERLRAWANEELDDWLDLKKPDLLKAADEIERLREALQKIADIEHEDIPSPKTPTEGIMWTVLAMVVGLAEDALKEGE
jgi:hypothetical protein